MLSFRMHSPINYNRQSLHCIAFILAIFVLHYLSEILFSRQSLPYIFFPPIFGLTWSLSYFVNRNRESAKIPGFVLVLID